MKTRRPSASLVSALAVAAVTLTALGAAWTAADSPAVADRPALDQPVQVVKAPSLRAMQQPVACHDCSGPAAPAGTY